MGYDTYYYDINLKIVERLSLAEDICIAHAANLPKYLDIPGELERSGRELALLLVECGWRGWCDWEICRDEFEWLTEPKSPRGPEHIRYLINAFLSPDSPLKRAMEERPDDLPMRQLSVLTFDHTVNGTVRASGDLPHDQWTITVCDNVVSHTRDEVIWD